MTPEFFTLLGVIILQLANMYNNYRTNKANAPLTNAQAESAMGDALDKLGQAYSKSLDTITSLNEELDELRPVTLKIAMQEQEMEQTKKDKADWKAHAERLANQLEENKIIPLAFRRLTNGNTDKMKAVTKEQVEAARKEKK